jgi:hypothetical protein
MTFIHPSLLVKHALFALFREGGLALDRLDSLSVPLSHYLIQYLDTPPLLTSMPTYTFLWIKIAPKIYAGNRRNPPLAAQGWMPDGIRSR